MDDDDDDDGDVVTLLLSLLSLLGNGLNFHQFNQHPASPAKHRFNHHLLVVNSRLNYPLPAAKDGTP